MFVSSSSTINGWVLVTSITSSKGVPLRARLLSYMATKQWFALFCGG
jgi:hypothetical protein